MKRLTKPVWSEGMYLGPHHFQLQSRYFEDSLHFASSALWRDLYGFVGLQIDSDALRNGTLAISHGRGLFEDGLAFDFPGSESAPQPREFGRLFSPVADHLTMHLAVPADSPDGRNTALDQGDPVPSRYSGVESLFPDEHSGRDERPIKIGRKNITLLTEGEITDQFTSLPVARVVRDGSGRFEADPTFVPPCLSIGASPALTGLLRRLVEILDEKSAVFAQEQQQRPGSFQAGMSARHVAQYWFLHALNSNVSALRHFLLTQHPHPQDLFREMSRLAGALCTFGLDVHPKSLPVYGHRDPGEGFLALDDHIRRHLEIVMPSRAIRIPLAPAGTSLFAGPVSDERCLGESRWILEIRASIGEGDLIERVLRLVKVCSAQFVPKLVERALPGMLLNHLPVPPPEIAANVDSQYFAINRRGPCWEHIVQTRRVGVYVPDEIPSPDLGLFVLLKG